MLKQFKLKKPVVKISRASLRKFVTSTKFLITAPIVVGLGLYLLGSYVWYNQVFVDEDQVFYGMVEKGLETDSIARSVIQTEGARNVKQTFFVRFSPETAVQSKSTIDQIDANREKSSITTETLGTNDVDYVRYSSISLPPSQAGGQNFDEVIGKWATRSGDEGGDPQLLNEAIFTFIPMGNFSEENRENLMRMIRDRGVYTISQPDLTYQNLRPVMTMDISIKPQALVEVLREYAEVSGVGNKDLLDPAQYEKSANIGIRVKIDVISRHLMEIEFPGQSRKEVFSAYGLTRSIEEPTDVISLTELQSRINE